MSEHGHVDHVVLWVDDPARALRFYVDVLGLAPEREAAFAAGEVPFPSVRVGPHTILDLFGRENVAAMQGFTGSKSGGTPVNHVCLALPLEAFDAACARLRAAGVELRSSESDSFGARGMTRHWVYFEDPDANVIELRAYAAD